MAKKKHAHHGGSWKVAYADFVTAMMALFLVLWLSAQDQKIKDAVARSFRHPLGASMTKESSGIIPMKDTVDSSRSEGNFDSTSAVELAVLRKLVQDLQRSLQTETDATDSNPFKIELLSDGVKMSVFDRHRQPVFEPGSARFTTYGTWVFSTLAWEVSRFQSALNVELEGHTETSSASARPGYDKWDLTTDRAHAARRILIEHAVSEGQIRKVIGFGDVQPLPGLEATDESNRRVTVMLRLRENSKP
ncbi:MAG: flagellar motor protein MotB [Limisphaerales bacterium]